MAQARYVVADAAGVAPGARRLTIECSHGHTSGVVAQGARPIDDLVVLDLLAIRHGTSLGCSCSEVLVPGVLPAVATGVPMSPAPDGLEPPTLGCRRTA